MLYNLVYAFLVMFKYIIYLIIFYPDPEHYNLDPIIPESLKRERYKLRVFEYERELNWIWKECPICLIGFKENDRVSPLPCDPRHFFHTECIRRWQEESLACPLCKREANTTKLYPCGYTYQTKEEYISALTL